MRGEKREIRERNGQDRDGEERYWSKPDKCAAVSILRERLENSFNSDPVKRLHTQRTFAESVCDKYS